jgi:hypothetical protein
MLAIESSGGDRGVEVDRVLLTPECRGPTP